MRFGSGMNAVQSLNTSGVQTCRACSIPCSSAAAGNPAVTAHRNVTVAARVAVAAALQIFDIGSFSTVRRVMPLALRSAVPLRTFVRSVRSIAFASHAAADCLAGRTRCEANRAHICHSPVAGYEAPVAQRHHQCLEGVNCRFSLRGQLPQC